ncbi:hypothetical protein [Psychroserpens algicola]|uniref:hypothetical protein n=1 Tax=Psychroserpens algicola TaxID=1719034 RepID=UPI0019532BD9|nr:hypothetical protein [Psychroserpens algicola]
MKIKLLALLCFTALLSCKNDSDIYKTTSGAYASKQGKFVAKFPTEPLLSVHENKIGFKEFQVYAYRSTLGTNKIFSVEYFDYPGDMIEAMPNQEFLEQAVSNYTYQMSANFELDFKEPVSNGDLEGIYFVLQPKENATIHGLKGMILGEVFKTSNRVYTITYLGIPDAKVDAFIDSFTIINE